MKKMRTDLNLNDVNGNPLEALLEGFWILPRHTPHKRACLESDGLSSGGFAG